LTNIYSQATPSHSGNNTFLAHRKLTIGVPGDSIIHAFQKY
jgi:hypothetical protein